MEKNNMNKFKVSVCIPYKQRLENLKIVFEALVDQTMPSSEFEVIIGAMEYSKEFLELCLNFSNKINITSVVTGRDFSIPSARNLAMRQATGNIIVQMDADSLLTKTSLDNLYNRHFAFTQQICVVGQVVGYGNNNDGSVTTVDHLEYKHYKKHLDELENFVGIPRDPRFQVPHIVPWAFGWTGFIALPLTLIKKYNLFFDEDFHGWGVDDLEWSYRICNAGIPIVLCEDIRAIHLPHVRDQQINQQSEKKNYKYFLKKWPCIDVELAHSFGDVKANELFIHFSQELKRITNSDNIHLAVVSSKSNNKNILIVGVEIKDGEIIDRNIITMFDNSSQIEVLHLIGMALPYEGKEFIECHVLSPILKFSTLYREKIDLELLRVAQKIINI